jgi:transposase-like protein
MGSNMQAERERTRPTFTPEQKGNILREYLIEGVPVSERVRQASDSSNALFPVAESLFRERNCRF